MSPITIPIYRSPNTENFMNEYRKYYDTDERVQELMKYGLLRATYHRRTYRDWNEYTEICLTDSVGCITKIDFDNMSIELPYINTLTVGCIIDMAIKLNGIVFAYPRAILPGVNTPRNNDIKHPTLVTFNVGALEAGYDLGTYFNIRILS